MEHGSRSSNFRRKTLQIGDVASVAWTSNMQINLLKPNIGWHIDRSMGPSYPPIALVAWNLSPQFCKHHWSMGRPRDVLRLFQYNTWATNWKPIPYLKWMVKNFRFLDWCSILGSWKQASNIPMRDLSQHHHHKASPGENQKSRGPAANGMGPLGSPGIPIISDWKLELLTSSQPLVDFGFGSPWQIGKLFRASWQLHLKYVMYQPHPSMSCWTKKNHRSSLQLKSKKLLNFPAPPPKKNVAQFIPPIWSCVKSPITSHLSPWDRTSVWESLRGSSSVGSSCGKCRHTMAYHLQVVGGNSFRFPTWKFLGQDHFPKKRFCR